MVVVCEDRAIWAAPAHLPDAPWAARGAAPQPLHSLCAAAGLGGQLLLAASPLGLLAAWCVRGGVQSGGVVGTRQAATGETHPALAFT